MAARAPPFSLATDKEPREYTDEYTCSRTDECTDEETNN